MTNKPETVNLEDLIRRKDGLYYKKDAKVPFTGISEEFLENGQILKLNYKNGKQHGPEEWFHDNGQLERKANFKNGKQHGPEECFDEDGNLESKGIYKNGKLITSEGWHKGQLTDKSYDYESDELIGGTTHESFHENGQLRMRKNWIDDLNHGFSEEYYENGQLDSRENYNYGVREGLGEKFHENGQLWYREYYKNGQIMDQLVEKFDEEGKLTKTETWENGELIEE